MPDDWSLKRLAWGYGCAKKGSEEEAIAKQRLLDAAALLLAGFDDEPDQGLAAAQSLLDLPRGGA
jgi:hypothetical protein